MGALLKSSVLSHREQVVTGLVAVGVVDGLEPVEVEQDQPERPTGSSTSIDMPLDLHGQVLPLQALLNRAAAARMTVDRRPLSIYDQVAGTAALIPDLPSVTSLDDNSTP